MPSSGTSSVLPKFSLCNWSEPEIRALETIIDGQIYTVHQFLPPSVCRGIVEQLSAQDWSFTDDIRVGEVCRFYSAEDSCRFWKETKLNEIASANDELGKDMLLGMSPNIRIYRYLPGQSFKPHC